ncbi:ABC transporter permease [Desulfovibrio sp. OttesenSCG-928-F07]|nr:ABC transporter permease [Desulfovibrio sp. OttesenSCG-928-F07]
MKNPFKSEFFYNFRRDPVAIGSGIIVLILLIASFFAPLLVSQNPYDGANFSILDELKPPMWSEDGDSQFPLGTDNQGRDMLSALMYGMRTSLLIGLGAVALQCSLGVIFGLLAGYKGGKIDTFIMRVADVELSFSSYMIAILLGAIFQMMFGVANYETIALPFLIIVIGLAEWPQYARTVRASVLAEKNKEYVEAARIIGLRDRRIMFRHILPNTLTPVLVISTVQVANAIMSEAALSFLGLGMPPTQPSLGSLIKYGFDYVLSGQWWITFFPGIVLVVLILAINLLGDWMRDYLNPKLYKG